MSKDDSGSNCGCVLGLIWLAINLTIGAFCFDYSLWSIFGKDVHWFGDVICGLFLGQFTIPIAVVCFVLRLCGIEAPFVGT